MKNSIIDFPFCETSYSVTIYSPKGSVKLESMSVRIYLNYMRIKKLACGFNTTLKAAYS